MLPLRTIVLIGAAFFFVIGTVRADEALRQAQEELRRRKLYFGEIDGRANRGTSEALRQFQELKGFERTGRLDDETRRALGLPPTGNAAPGSLPTSLADRSLLLLQNVLRCYEAGDIEGELGFYAEQVRYFEDGVVRRDFIREVRQRELRRWPQRRVVLLNRIASPAAGAPEEIIVTARYRLEASDGRSQARPRTEDVTFVLRETRGELRIVAVGSVE